MIFWQEFTHSLLSLPWDPSKRLFWFFCLTAALLALFALVLQGKKISWRRIKHTFFNRHYWLTKSTLVDTTYLIVNSAIRISVLIPLVGSQLALTLIVARFFQYYCGNAPELGLPWWSVAVLYTATFFLLEDFSRFLLHFSMHRVPFLWKLHKVHHSATMLTPLTLYRIHPVEMCLYFFRSIIVFGCVSGVFVYLFGGQLSGFDILGVDLLGFVFSAVGANLRHSHIAFSFGRFERWFMSPMQHQIHHSLAAEHKDKNFGTCLACWDALFNAHVLSQTLRQRNISKVGFTRQFKRLKFGLS